jgi:hypothetical protein
MAPFPWNLGLQQAQNNNGKVIPPRIEQQRKKEGVAIPYI